MGYAVIPSYLQDTQNSSENESDSTQSTLPNEPDTATEDNATEDKDSSSVDTDRDAEDVPTVPETETETETLDRVDAGTSDSGIDTSDTETETETETETDTVSSTDQPDSGTAKPDKVPLTWQVLRYSWSWISRKDNELGIQGGWNAYADSNSNISWIWQDITENRVCVSGKVENSFSVWEFTYGAKVGFDLCGTRLPWHDNTAYPLARCPWSPNLHESIIGFEFSLTGELPPTELRAQFQEQERDDGTYVLIDGPGTQQILFEDATLAYDENAAPINISEIIGFWLYVPVVISGNDYSEFNFCIEELNVLLGK